MHFLTYSKDSLRSAALKIGAFAITVTNALIFVFFALAMHRIVASSEQDLGGTLGLLAAALAIVPTWKYTALLKRERTTRQTISIDQLIRPSAISILFLIVAICLWQFILPAMSLSDYKTGLKAHEEGRYATAIKHYQRSLYKTPSRAEAHFALANLYADTTYYDAAKQHYWLAIYSKDTSFKAYNNLARLYIREGEFDAALDLLFLAQKHNASPGFAYPQNQRERQAIINKNMAWSHLGLDNYPLAQEHIQKALILFNTSGTIEQHTSAFCLAAIIFKHIGNEKDGKLHRNSCSPTHHKNPYRGIERALERQANLLYRRH